MADRNRSLSHYRRFADIREIAMGFFLFAAVIHDRDFDILVFGSLDNCFNTTR